MAMIAVQLACHIPGMSHLSGERQVPEDTSVAQFLSELGYHMDYAAMVLLNGKAAPPAQALQSGDKVVLLLPLSGG